MLLPLLLLALPPPSAAGVFDDFETIDAAPELDLAPLALGAINATARYGDLLYVARAEGGVAVVDVSDARAPLLVGALLEGKVVSRLFLDGDRLIALVLAEEAWTFSLDAPLAPLAVAPLLPRAPPRVVAEGGGGAAAGADEEEAAAGVVVEVQNGRVVFEGAGFRAGQRVKVVSQRLTEKPDLERGAGVAKVPAGDVTAVVLVEEAGAERAMAVLGRGDVAVVGDLVEATDLPLSESLFLPRRAPFALRAGFHVRPFFGLATDGFPVGALTDVYAHGSFTDVPLAFSLELAPVGFAVLAADTHYPAVLSLGASYVTDWFEVGLGAGAVAGNEGPCTREVIVDDEGKPQLVGERTCEQNTGFTVNQLLRLGAIDGIHLAWSSSILARRGGFVLGMGRAELAVPVSSRVGLFAAGGVGENGWAFGDVGVRTMFGGTGGPGTVIVSASLGGAGVFDGPGVEVEELGAVTVRQDVVAGPAVGFGVEWRW